MRDLLYWLGFDIMGDFVFNKSFNMLHDQKWHHMVVRLQLALCQPRVDLLMRPGGHFEPIGDSPDAGEDAEGELDEPGGGEADDHVVPFLVVEHVEGFVEDEVAHYVEAEPVD